MNKITVVIPNWNGEKYLKTCFDSLKKQSFKDFEIILVDNASNDKSIEFTRNNYPEIKIIRLKKNTGFAPAVNVGIKSSATDFIALLNNDTEVDSKWLYELYKAAGEYKDAGFFASKMLDFKNRTIIDSCGDAASWKGKFTNIGRLEIDGEKFKKQGYVFGACAGAALYRKELFDKIGLFDEDFFAYLEDVDISFRAQLAGFKCVFVPTAIVYHIGSATSGKKSGFNFKLVIKNRWHVIYKDFPVTRLVFHIPVIICVELRFFLAAMRHGFIKEYFWGIKQALKEHQKMIAKRQKIQNSRKVTLEYLDSLMENL